MTELKPCPFCGGEVEVAYNPYTNMYFVVCGNAECDVCVNVSSKLKTEVIRIWNRRINNG